MDNRTGFRRRGPGYLADQARQALGLSPEANVLAEIPMPVVHTAFGLAVCAAAVLLRPEALGLATSALADGALALFTALVLLGYDVLVYPPDARPGLEGAALPVAAVLSFATVLAGVPQLLVRVAGGVLAALVIGGVPHLAGRRAVGREGWVIRLMRDASGIAVLAPVLLAAVSPVLSPAPRIGLAGGVVALVSIDGLRTERVAALRSLVAALVVALGVAAGVAITGTSAVHAGIRAAALMVVWYGLRGVAGALADPRRHAGLVVEYGVFVVAAAAALAWVSITHL